MKIIEGNPFTLGSLIMVSFEFLKFNSIKNTCKAKAQALIFVYCIREFSLYVKR